MMPLLVAGFIARRNENPSRIKKVRKKRRKRLTKRRGNSIVKEKQAL
jgi:hypothetical protein